MLILKYFNAENKIFWNMKLYKPAEVHRRFGGTYCLHLARHILTKIWSPKRG
jgi:hypothetical protein